jgi:glycosyltransferase involved in cell wall biosynthesis
VYGHDNTYFQSLCAKFSEFRILLSKSDKEGLNVFLSRVDIVASVAEGEGFGRPIAAALLAGVPVKLLDHPVFREFFNGGAHFYLDIDDLVQSLREFDLNDTYPAFTAPAEFVDAYVDAKIIIHQAAQLSV